MNNQQAGICKTQINSIQEIPLDVAWAEGFSLKNAVRADREGVTIFAGTHEQHGNIHIIIPAVGNGLLLFPFVVQDF